MLNLEAVNTYEGTSDIHGLIIGRGITRWGNLRYYVVPFGTLLLMAGDAGQL
jgi:hypothetical protein